MSLAGVLMLAGCAAYGFYGCSAGIAQLPSREGRWLFVLSLLVLVGALGCLIRELTRL